MREVGVSGQKILTTAKKARRGSSVVAYESHIGRNSDFNENLSGSRNWLDFFSVFTLDGTKFTNTTR